MHPGHGAVEAALVEADMDGIAGRNLRALAHRLSVGAGNHAVAALQDGQGIEGGERADLALQACAAAFDLQGDAADGGALGFVEAQAVGVQDPPGVADAAGGVQQAVAGGGDAKLQDPAEIFSR
jgi:hypothetical protein